MNQDNCEHCDKEILDGEPQEVLCKSDMRTRLFVCTECSEKIEDFILVL
jgi:DNA-directed RNA polymerase subunit RPC12/RpoP